MCQHYDIFHVERTLHTIVYGQLILICRKLRQDGRPIVTSYVQYKKAGLPYLCSIVLPQIKLLSDIILFHSIMLCSPYFHVALTQSSLWARLICSKLQQNGRPIVTSYSQRFTSFELQKHQDLVGYANFVMTFST